MIFENAINTSRKGDIGESRAIYEYTKLGYVVSRTLFDSAKYDLVIDDGNGLIKVQVKTTTIQTGKNKNGWQVELRTATSSNRFFSHRTREDNDYDIIFVMTGDDRCWSIPMSCVDSKSGITVGNKKYHEFEIK